MPVEYTVLKEKYNLLRHVLIPHHESVADRQFEEVRHPRHEGFTHGYRAVSQPIRLPRKKRQMIDRARDHPERETDRPQPTRNRMLRDTQLDDGAGQERLEQPRDSR